MFNKCFGNIFFSRSSTWCGCDRIPKGAFCPMKNDIGYSQSHIDYNFDEGRKHVCFSFIDANLVSMRHVYIVEYPITWTP